MKNASGDHNVLTDAISGSHRFGRFYYNRIISCLHNAITDYHILAAIRINSIVVCSTNII